MRVAIGDGRTVECATGIQKVPAGPTPATLATERCRPTTVHPRRSGGERPLVWFPVFLHVATPLETP